MDTLHDIATIHMGYTFRGSVKDAAKGDTSIIQMKDAWPDKIGQTSTFNRVRINTLPAHFPLCVGDLIFRSRTPHTTTVLIEKIMPLTICAAPLMVIRVRLPEKVLPAYLNWFINSPHTQQVLVACATGAKSQMISQSAMARLEVLVPTLAAQRHIVAEEYKVRQFMREQAIKLKQAQGKSDDYLWEHATDNLASLLP